MSKTSWFMTHARYKSYMLHEVSSLFVGLYMALLIDGLFRLAQRAGRLGRLARRSSRSRSSSSCR